MSFIQKPAVLASFFVLMLASIFGFSLWVPHVGGEMLDTLSSPDEVRALLASMSSEQKQLHLAMTLVLDTIFPLAAGCFFAGVALKFFGRAGIWLAIPALAIIPLDLLENTVQVMALLGNESLLPVKAVVSPVKSSLFLVAVLIALCALVYGVVQKIRNR